MKKKFFEKGNMLLPLNIQLFADEVDNNGNSTESNPNDSSKDSYSKEEYENLQKELQKLKNSNSKLSSEIAQKKKEERERLSKEEQEQLNKEEKDQKYAEMEKELNSIKMQSELSKSGLDDKSISSLIEVLTEGDNVEICKKITSIVNAQVEKKVKEMELQNQHNQHYPQPSNKNGQIDDFMKRRIESRKKK